MTHDPTRKLIDLEAVEARLRVSEGPDKTWVSDQATVLLAEVDRLRRLLERVVVIAGDDSPTCPSDQGECWWCDSDLRPVREDGSLVDPRTEHAPGCPWPELEAAVSGWKKAQPAAKVLTWHPGTAPQTVDPSE